MARPTASAGKVLERAIGSLPVPLASERAQKALWRIASRLPVSSTTFGFECRLAAANDRVDFGIALRPDALQGLILPSRPSRGARGDVIWHRLYALGRAWSVPDSLLERWMPFLFLEFDEGCPLTPLPFPSVFLGLDSPLERRAALDAHQGPLAALGAAVAMLRRRAMPASLVRRVFDVVRALPADAHLIHAGVLLARRARGLRLSLALPPYALEATLGRLCIPAAAVAVRAVQALTPMIGGLQLDCDFRPAASGGFGLGLRPQRPEAWSELCAWTVGQGWCAPSKAQALLGWQEGPTLSTVPNASSAGLERMLSHIKLAVSAAGEVGAKAYFGFRPRPT